MYSNYNVSLSSCTLFSLIATPRRQCFMSQTGSSCNLLSIDGKEYVAEVKKYSNLQTRNDSVGTAQSVFIIIYCISISKGGVLNCLCFQMEEKCFFPFRSFISHLISRFTDQLILRFNFFLLLLPKAEQTFPLQPLQYFSSLKDNFVGKYNTMLFYS